MIHQNEFEKVQQIAGLVGMHAPQISPLTRGATSAAYRMDEGKNSVIVRIMPVNADRPVTYQSEFTILRRLQASGAPVPKPILTSVEVKTALPISEPWAVTGIVPGRAIQKMPLSASVASELGSFLRVLHALPVAHFGRLCEESDRLYGQQTDPIAGLCARWCWAPLWPLDGQALSTHPIAGYASELLPKLFSIQTRLLEVASIDRVVLAHTDLHGEHIFVSDDRITGIIDFGAAAICPPAWDFAVIAFYHGWHACQAVLAGYTDQGERQRLFPQIQKVTIMLALYKVAKAISANADHTKVDRIVQFLKNMLAECKW